jgi:ABC-2 type transport system ATP-binding protein
VPDNEGSTFSLGSYRMLVETQQLTKRYGAFAALANCSLQVGAGEIFGLLGPNGAGKTTLLRLLLGYLRPTSGHAWIDELDCWQNSMQVHQRLSYLPGEPRLFRHMNGRETIAFFTRLRKNGTQERALKLAERLGLDLSRGVAMMSTGMRQKLALAITLAADTPLIILDEPTSNLDPTVRNEVALLVLEAKQAGRTIIFSSHVLSEVEATCDRVALLRAGEVVYLQKMHELRRQHRITAELTGTMTAIPEALTGQVEVHPGRNGDVTITTPSELSPVLGWLATLPLKEVRIEPVGLQTVYDRFHPPTGS